MEYQKRPYPETTSFRGGLLLLPVRPGQAHVERDEVVSPLEPGQKGARGVGDGRVW